MLYIAGMGVSGSYLLRRLRESGFDATGYDPKKPGFYVPCGYAVNINRLREFTGKIGLEPENYLEKEAQSVTFQSEGGINIELSSAGFCTIDKNRLESDILNDMRFENKIAPRSPGKDHILVDATGISRYYLGPARGDFVMRTKEYLADFSTQGGFIFKYFPDGRGYYWEFPLKSGFHVGAGGDTIELVERSLSGTRNIKRVMSRNIRLSPLFDQAHKDNIIGIGESIGTVSPITGEGIVPSMESAEILFNCISKYDDLEELKEKYVSEIRSKFKRYEKLFALLTNARQGKLKKVGNLSVISSAKEDFANFGIQLEILKVLKQIVFN